jgi:hypothetical protein
MRQEKIAVITFRWGSKCVRQALHELTAMEIPSSKIVEQLA